MSRNALPLPLTEAPRVEELMRENALLRRQVAELEAYRTLAYRDQLTGIWNRRYFAERFAEELSRTRRRPKRKFSVMVVDVNDLKSINDAYGHADGDLVLRWVAEFLERTLRAHDVICRTGGDEFTVLFPELGVTEGTQLLVRLRTRLADAQPEAPFAIGLSFGLAVYPNHGRTFEELMHFADDAMYEDKRRQKAAAAPAEPAEGAARPAVTGDPPTG